MKYEEKGKMKPVFDETTCLEKLEPFAPEIGEGEKLQEFFKTNFKSVELSKYVKIKGEDPNSLNFRTFNNYWNRLLCGLRQEQWHFYLNLEPYFLGPDETVLKKILERLVTPEE